jgi:hypothetical protein
MSLDSRLYRLLPALYRIRDDEYAYARLSPAEQQALDRLDANPEEILKGPLKSLLYIISEQVAVLEENLDQLYDDQFIETCAEWVVPYIGQLVGARSLIEIPGLPYSQRGEVANTISFRRRKGTASVIEQLAKDITGWPSNVVEYFTRLATTQYLNHIRPENLSVSGLSDWEKLEYANTSFGQLARTADVRRIAVNRGRYNIPNIGIFLWRLRSFTIGLTPMHRIDNRRFTFNRLGQDRQLYSKAEPEDFIIHLATPVNVPMPISRRVMCKNLNQYYALDKSIALFVNNQAIDTAQPYIPVVPVSPGAPIELKDIICICNLSDVSDNNGVIIDWANMPVDKIAIDPVRGRVAFPADVPVADTIQAISYYAFSTEMGGGGYEREQSFSLDVTPVVTVGTESGDVPDIQTAIAQLAATGGSVVIKDNRIYSENITIKLAAGKSLEIRAADQMQPVLLTSTSLILDTATDTGVTINGLLISGTLSCPFSSALASLRLVHTTIIPEPSQVGLIVNKAGTVVSIEKSIIGAIRMHEDASLHVLDSTIDACNKHAVAFASLNGDDPGGVLNIVNSTVIGKIHARILELVSNCIFYSALAINDTWKAPVLAQRLQEGCVRFSWLPAGSRIPRPFSCQPARQEDVMRIKPMFNSLRYGDPGYCQLNSLTAVEIVEGADDGSEMGVLHQLYQPQRIANLKTRLDEYLRFGLEAGIFFAS